MNAKMKKAIQQSINKLDATLALDNINFYMHVEALAMNDMYNMHVEALELNKLIMFDKLTHKEKNAVKRQLNTLKVMSSFCKSTKVDCQAFRIDESLTEFHTMKELLKELSDMREARIKSHISFLETNFVHTCKKEYDTTDKRKFRFVAL
jgi:hypothetical protein